MRLNVEKILKTEGFTQKFEYKLDLSSYEMWGEKPFNEPIEVTGEVANKADMVVLTTQAYAHYKTQCAMCLKELDRELRIDSENYIVTEIEDSKDDDRLIMVENGEVDIDEIVRSNIILNMPIQQLCKQDCKGLCPKCGIDLNCNTCDCNKKEVDPRLAILKTLL